MEDFLWGFECAKLGAPRDCEIRGTVDRVAFLAGYDLAVAAIKAGYV